MIKYITGNLFDFIDDHNPVMIAHICNDQGAWGAGFVVPLAQKYPIAEMAYRDWYKGTYTEDFVPQPLDEEVYFSSDWCDLGEIQIIQAKPHVHICNMIAQKLGGQRPLIYNSLVKCMDELASWMDSYSMSHIMCPQFGSGLAGGSWIIISELINDCWIRAGLNVTVVKYK